MLSSGEGLVLRRVLAGALTDYCSTYSNKVSLISQSGIHQLHIFIFILAVCHILYNVITMALGQAKAKLSISGKDFRLTLFARRSRHFAGTRYLKRGVNEKGRIANDVETEQIVSEDIPGGTLTQFTSVLQNRGSIPLFWSQETSRLNITPDIILQKKEKNYEATRLHFENLVKRYGNPIIILNLIKAHEKRPRESILRAEFATAIDIINKDLSEENRLKFLHWDLHKHSRRKAGNVLVLLGKVATYALNLTGFFYCQMTPALRLEGSLKWPVLVQTSRAQAHRTSVPMHAETSDHFEEEHVRDKVEPITEDGGER